MPRLRGTILQLAPQVEHVVVDDAIGDRDARAPHLVDELLAAEQMTARVDKCREHFELALDLGGILELYPSTRTVARLELGNTAIRHRSSAALWTNLHLLFWLSVVPFVTGWMGENHFAPVPTAAYGVVLLMAAMAYWILQRVIIRSQGPGSLLLKAVGGDWKGNVSPVLYVIGILTAPFSPALAGTIYAVVAVIWLVPDKRIERVLRD